MKRLIFIDIHETRAHVDDVSCDMEWALCLYLNYGNVGIVMDINYCEIIESGI